MGTGFRTSSRPTTNPSRQSPRKPSKTLLIMALRAALQAKRTVFLSR
jgi:hypothetical protein